MADVKRPSESSTIAVAMVGLAVVVVEALMSRYVLAEPILDNGTRAVIVMGALTMVGFRFRTDSAIRFLWFIPILLVLAGCAGATAAARDMYGDNMEQRVDNVKVIDIGRDNRGLVLRIPRPTEPGESILEVILGWSREYVAVVGIPVSADDKATYMRASNMGASADNAFDGTMDDILLIQVEVLDMADDEEVEEGVVDE